MDPDNVFLEFVRRLRAGDPTAAVELVQRYEPLIRREARLHLRGDVIRSLFDSGDICQSVLKSLLIRVAAGQFDLESPDDLRRLVLRIARNKVATRARQVASRPQDGRRAGAEESENAFGAMIDPTCRPEQMAQGRDLLAELLSRLGEEERELVRLRSLGHSWPEIVALLGGSVEARRKQLVRAVNRVAAILELGDTSR